MDFESQTSCRELDCGVWAVSAQSVTPEWGTQELGTDCALSREPGLSMTLTQELGGGCVDSPQASISNRGKESSSADAS